MIVKAHWVLKAAQDRSFGTGPALQIVPVAQVTTATRPPVGLPPPGAKIIELWSNPHKIWCCENMGVACATSSDSEKVGLGTAEDL